MTPTPRNALVSQNDPASEKLSREITPGRNFVGSDGVIDDVQEQFERLQERYQRCTTSLASAAHDLKTPLSIISGYVNVLQGEKLGSLNARQHEVLQDMDVSCKRLQSFIQDFLTYAVLETGEMRMHFELGDLNASLSEVCGLWSPRFQEKGLALYFLANDKVSTFPFDAPKVQRIVSNLLDNACKFTPAGGTVWLHADPYTWERRGTQPSKFPNDRRQRALAVPNAVKVSVADTGPGISAEFHSEVFDDFFRIPLGNTEVEGTGLGLAIVRRFVHAFGGKVWVESDANAGCKFSFLIPLTPASSLEMNQHTHRDTNRGQSK
jgi:signal transduction histidine kinase